MQPFLRATAVIACGVALFGVMLLPGFVVSMPSWYAFLLIWAPFVGATLGAYRVSRDSTPGRRTWWLLGGGLGLGLVAWITCAYLVQLTITSLP